MDELMELVELDRALVEPSPDSVSKGEAVPVCGSGSGSGSGTGSGTLTLGSAEPLANAKLPYYQNQRERYTHRIMLEKAAQGYTVKEIAEQTGYSCVAVNNILRQPYAQQTLVDEIRRIHGVDEEVVEIIKNNVVKAAKLYATVLNDPNADRKDRMLAADKFFDRRYGKAVQPMSQGNCIDLNSLSDDELKKMLPTATTGTNA